MRLSRPESRIKVKERVKKAKTREAMIGVVHGEVKIIGEVKIPYCGEVRTFRMAEWATMV